MNSFLRSCRSHSRKRPAIVVVVLAPRDPGEEDLAPDPGGGLARDPDKTDQGHPGGAEMTVDLAQANSWLGAGPNPQEVATATVAATTTTAGGTTTMRRRRTPLRIQLKVSILSSPPLLPLQKPRTHPSLLLLHYCCSPHWVLLLVWFPLWISCL